MANVRLGAKAVGSIVKIKVNGAAKDFIIVHQGKPSSVYDDSCQRYLAADERHLRKTPVE